MALILWALTLPTHLRALDAKVLETSAAQRPGLVEAGLTAVSLERIGPARMLLAVAERENVPGTERLAFAIKSFSATHPRLVPWGGSDPYLEQLFQAEQAVRELKPRPIVEHLLAYGARERMLEFLRGSRRPGVQQILGNRFLTETVHFRPVSSAAGQPLEAAIVLAGMLFQGDHLAPPLRDTIGVLSAEANRGGDVTRVEQVYLDLISLGMRLDWMQLAGLIRQVEEVETLRHMTFLIRRAGEELPVIYSAVYLSQSPEATTDFLMRFGESGMNDMRFALRWGEAGVRELVDRQQRIYYADYRQPFVEREPLLRAYLPFLRISENTPGLAVVLKYLLVLLGAFLLARSINYLRRSPSQLEEPLRVRGLDTRRQVLFAACFVLILLVFAEPFLAQEDQSIKPPIRWHFPVLESPVVAQITNTLNPIMNQITLLAVAVFLAIQVVLYVLCLIKLAEIRRQSLASHIKLRLLDNEENLFDAGLYVGLGGTVISLVLLAVGIVEASLMAAYSSTLFGIIFVALFKIGHLRPIRRRLILESESTIS